MLITQMNMKERILDTFCNFVQIKSDITKNKEEENNKEIPRRKNVPKSLYIVWTVYY